MNIKRIIAQMAMVAVLLNLFGVFSFSENVIASTGLENWTISAKGPNMGAYVDTETVYSGTGSLKMYNNTPAASNMYLGLITPFQVQKGKTYKYGFMAKADAISQTTVMIDWGTRMSLIPFTSTYDWQPFEFTYKHKEDATIANLRFVMDDISTALWLDEIYCYEVKDGNMVGENLIKNGKFDIFTSSSATESTEGIDVDSLTKYLITSKSIPVYKADNIEIDGDISDWGEEYNTIPITGVSMLKETKPDVKANIRLAWDEKYLYVATDVIDDMHESMSGSGFWQGDCMQVVMSNDSDSKTYGSEMGFTYIASEDKSEVCQIENPDTKFKALMKDGKLFYEIAIPWSIQFGDVVPKSLLFNALVNDTDNNSRNYCMEINPTGISVDKSAIEDPTLLLVEKPEDVKFLAGVYGDREISIGADNEYTISVFNNTDETVTYKITCEENDVTTDLTVAPKSEGKAKLIYNATGAGSFILHFNVSDDENEQKLSRDLAVLYTVTLPSLEECKSMIKDMEGYIEDIEPLMTQCAQMGYALDYEMADFYILQRFTEIHKEKVENGNYEFITYQHAKLTEIYNSLKKTLESYIKGEAKPLDVPRMVTSEERDVLSGESFIREVEYKGQIEKRPYYYVGTGHWDYVWNDFENVRKFGYDLIHIEIGPNSVIFPESFAAGWDIKVTGAVPDYSVTVQSETVKDGSCAMKVVNNTPYNYNNFFRVYQTVNVEPDTVYEFGAQIKGTNIANSTQLYLGNTAYQDRMSIGGTYDWTQYSGTYKTEPDETSMNFTIVSDSPSTAFYVDNAYLRVQGEEENILANPGFENGSYDPESIGNGMKVKYNKIEELEKVFRVAEENNMEIALLITPHYFPTFLATIDPTINDNGKVPTVFMPFNPTHPTVQMVLEEYIKILIPRIKDYKSLHSIVLSNEPAFSAALGEYYLPIYREHLKNMYGTIENLNKAYGGAEYKSFDDIGWPKSVNSSQYWMDYNNFNDKIMDDYHKYLSDAVRSVAPEIPLHTKQTGMFRKHAWLWYQDYRINGTNYEQWTDSIDIAGCDGGASSFNGEDNNIYKLLGWYDWLSSVKPAPVMNTEDHILSATDTMDYSEQQPIYCAAQVWQGAIHGRSGTTLWLWDTTEFGENNSLLTNRPMVVSMTGKAGFDLNRAAYEVSAIQNEPRRIAILKSENSMDGNMMTSNAYYNAYVATLENGLRPFFITDLNYKKMHDYDIVIVPDARYVTNDLVSELDKYASSGGKLLIIGDKSLSSNEIGQERDRNIVENVFNKAETISVTYNDNLITNVEDVENLVGNAIESEKLDYISVYDKETGEKVKDTEWLSGAYDGNIAVNICNMEWDKDKTVYIEVNGKRVESFYEVRSDKVYENGEITVKGYEPVIVTFKAENPFFDTFGHWAEDNISALYEKGLIKGKTSSRFAPDDTLTGGEIATLFARMAGVEFDQSGANWYDGAVNAVKSIGIDGGELENPKATVSREAIAHIAVLFYEYKTGEKAEMSEVVYRDKENINTEKYDFVMKATALGIMKGDESGNFRPEASISRGEISAVIERINNIL